MPDDTTVFVCYRRADEPFAAGLLGAALFERFGTDRVFLDTVTIGRSRRFEQELIARARTSSVLLVVIGVRWDNEANAQRLVDEDDWVRRELLEARNAAVPIIPVLVERPALPNTSDLPDELGWLDSCSPVHVSRPHVRVDVDRIMIQIESGAAIPPQADEAFDNEDDLDEETVRRATLAMVGHVLPDPQAWSGNDRMIAQTVSEHLAKGEWLRYLAAGRLPGRPRGSGIIIVTDTELRVIDLNDDFKAQQVIRRPLNLLTIELTPRKRLWLHTADLRLRCLGFDDLEILGLFRTQAELLLETVPQADRTGR